MNTFFKKWRCIIIFAILGACAAAILVYYGRLAAKTNPIPAKKRTVVERGTIVDRSGFPLAVQSIFYHIGISTRNLSEKQIQEFAETAALPLEMEASEIEQILKNAHGKFVYLRKKAPQSVYQDLVDATKGKKMNFISYEKVIGRNYPNHALASQLIGYMGSDEKGLAGIEFSQQEILQPALSENSQEEQAQGKNIFLTIDANLQYKLEQICYEAMEKTQAADMMLIAADSKTGEILSYISLPAANLDEYGNASAESKIDRPAMNAYEPGSVFKIFTIGIIYDHNGISPNDTFLCDGAYEKKLSSGETIKIGCLDHHGLLTPRDALRFSCNDVLGQISDKIGDEEFMQGIRNLGFGSKTGLEVPGETSGFVKEPYSKTWSARSKPTIAIGQEISVSALQMVQATTAIANGGIPVKLTAIHKITNKDGTVFYEHEPQYKDRALSKTAADYVLSCMETTARTGTGSRANLKDISIGVKTGTAQMADKEKGGYSTTDFISNCMAIFPVEDPQIILYIVIEKAKGETYAGRIVAPVIADAADVIIDHLGMSRGGASSLEHDGIITLPQSKKITIGDKLPDFTGKSKRDLMSVLERTDLHFILNGKGWVVSQNPEPGTPVTENMTIELNLE